jgi:hypothetical protein
MISPEVDKLVKDADKFLEDTDKFFEDALSLDKVHVHILQYLRRGKKWGKTNASVCKQGFCVNTVFVCMWRMSAYRL